MLGEEEFYLISGDIHYFRIHPSDWSQRLDYAVDFGLTAIQVYVPWHLHEYKKGQYDFYGQAGELDLVGFLELAQQKGLKVMLRPGPYICSECDLGGLPSWLLKNKDIQLRCSEKGYLEAVEKYFKQLIKKLLPYLSTNGGPVIAVQLENEYGGFGNDRLYLEELRRIYEENGVDVPFYTTDGLSALMTVNGSLEDCWHGINFRSNTAETEKALEVLGNLRPNFPLFVGEFWCGRSMNWGENFSPRTPKETADAFKLALKKGAYVNFYMFAGGTNFGFTSGSTVGVPFVRDMEKKYPKFLPYTTSYDVDALIGEDGNPTEKYFLCRDALDEFLGKEKRSHKFTKRKSQSIDICLTEQAALFDNLENLAVKCEKSLLPLTFEELDQSFGYVLYSTDLRGADSWSRLCLENSVKDRATVYMNGEYKATYMRDGEKANIEFTVPKQGLKLELLVENLGRINTTVCLGEHKGMVKPQVTENCKNAYNWTQYSLPFDDLSKLNYKAIKTEDEASFMPMFLKGVFDAKAGVDAFISLDGFTHGNVWINGFNIGRYWNIKPQKTLYISGKLLKEKDNIIEIFDAEYNGKTVNVKCQAIHNLTNNS